MYGFDSVQGFSALYSDISLYHDYRAFSLWFGGIRSAIYGGIFFTLVAFSGWWDRSVITLYTVISAVIFAMIIGIPAGIAAARVKNGPSVFC